MNTNKSSDRIFGQVVKEFTTPSENGCRVTLTHELPDKWEEYTESTEAAWSLMLDKLYNLFE